MIATKYLCHCCIPAHYYSILDHPNVLGFEGACIHRSKDDESVFMIVTELMEKGSLKVYIYL